MAYLFILAAHPSPRQSNRPFGSYNLLPPPSPLSRLLSERGPWSRRPGMDHPHKRLNICRAVLLFLWAWLSNAPALAFRVVHGLGRLGPDYPLVHAFYKVSLLWPIANRWEPNKMCLRHGGAVNAKLLPHR